MIILNKQNITDNVIVTLNDSKTLTTPYYLFVFTNVTTNELVNHIANSANDLSDQQQRYNEFVIDSSTIFATSSLGQWQYQIYEQASSTNTNVTGLNLLEYGKMKLTTSDADLKIGFEPANEIKKGFNG